MTKEARRRFTIEQKATILRRHLVDKVAVSDLCDEYKIQPSVLYTWQRQAMANLELSLETNGRGRGARTREARLEGEIDALKTKLAKKDGVIAEISEEYVHLKKTRGAT